MSTHFKWYPDQDQVTVPWNARYTFPSQANKSVKITPRISPKNGSVFSPGQVIRLEFPSQGYINPANTFLSFDVTLIDGVSGNGLHSVHFQNNINSIFHRARILYGANPLEDLNNYNVIVRNLTEWTATAGNTFDQTSIMEGIAGAYTGYGINGMGLDPPTTTTVASEIMSMRPASIQGISHRDVTAFPAPYDTTDYGFVPNKTTPQSGQAYTVRKYNIQFAFGLFTQGKLLPAKFMASQLAIELTLATEEQCMFASTADFSVKPTYNVSNINLIPEILEFDPSYDASIVLGLQNGGVPIKFSSYHTFQFPISTTVNALIQERSRSVKSLFAVVRRSPPVLDADSGATISTYKPDTTIQSYQYRIGGRYFPASPVQISTVMGSAMCNGGAEAFAELQKALNTVGDYRLSSAVNNTRWAYPMVDYSQTPDAGGPTEGEKDYTKAFVGYTPAGSIQMIDIGALSASGIGSQCFAMATSLESSNGLEISGLNAEEQSDISLQANWSAGAWTTSDNGAASYILEVYSYYDAMIVLRENNVVELTQ